MIIVTGGESDIAYANGKRDFETMPAKIPVFYGVHPSVGHGGTYNEDNGGAFGVTAVAWLKWQLMNDTSAKRQGAISSATKCGICSDSKWQVSIARAAVGGFIGIEERAHGQNANAEADDSCGRSNHAVLMASRRLMAQAALQRPQCASRVRCPQAGGPSRTRRARRVHSKVTGNKRPAMVYLPPGYSATQKYPVLYLLHGIGGNENHWTQFGKADSILDNLIADNKAVPMIVVMPNGRASNEPATAVRRTRRTRGATGTARRRAAAGRRDSRLPRRPQAPHRKARVRPGRSRRRVVAGAEAGRRRRHGRRVHGLRRVREGTALAISFRSSSRTTRCRPIASIVRWRDCRWAAGSR